MKFDAIHALFIVNTFVYKINDIFYCDYTY